MAPDFPFLAANVRVKETGETLFPPYLIKEYGAVKVGYIGLTLEGTPDAVSPEAVAPVEFLDEVEVINKYTKELQDQGVEAIVVVIHEGGYPEADLVDINDCPGLSGPIVQIHEGMDPAVDAIVAGHTHQAFNCEMDGRLITSAKSYGRILTEIELKIDPATGEVVEKKATNLAVRRDVGLDPEMVDHLRRYRGLVGPMAQRKVGVLPQDILRKPDEHGYSALGGLIADAQLAATSPRARGGAEIAFMNLGGVRDDMRHAASGAEGDGVITYEELFDIQPFGNTVVVLELTGAQIEQLLEQQWQGEGTVRLLQPSVGFSYTWRDGEDLEDHVDPSTLEAPRRDDRPRAALPRDRQQLPGLRRRRLRHARRARAGGRRAPRPGGLRRLHRDQHPAARRPHPAHHPRGGRRGRRRLSHSMATPTSIQGSAPS